MSRATRSPLTRLHLAFGILFVVGAIIILKLFYLQVIKGGEYREIQATEQQGYTTLQARRGEIYALDPHTGEPYKLATNITLKMIYADPVLIVKDSDPEEIAEVLAPLLFDLDEAKELDQIRMDQETDAAYEIEDETARNEVLEKIQPKTDEELYEDYLQELTDLLGQSVRDYILLNIEPLSEDEIEQIEDLDLDGIEVTGSGDLYAFPADIDDKAEVAADLSTILDWDAKDLMATLDGENRFVIIKHKLDPEVSSQIEDILDADAELPAEDQVFVGIRLVDEYYRFYPEGDFLAQVLGWVDGDGNGQYGLELSFNDILKGVDGIFTSSIDPNGNQVTVGNTVIQSAVDGADIYLTIDRVIQMKVEELLAYGVEATGADGGQAIVVNAKTGEVLAMAQYPDFDPNNFREVYEIEPFDMSTDEKETRLVNKGTEEEPEYWYIIQAVPLIEIQLFQDADNPNLFWAYKNKVGPYVYINKNVQEYYETGSIFKPITMVAAIDSGEVSPQTTVNDSGPIQLDEYWIDNFDFKHLGVIDMTDVLIHSNNIGMVFVSQQLGPALFYDYLKKFGFGQRTGIELPGEVKGILEYYTDWSLSELGTKSFGQGIAVTPIQMIQAYTALANDGVMMKPYLVQKIVYSDGREQSFEPQAIGQIISPTSAETITAMLTAVCESYAEQGLKYDNHYMACKSGTAQTYINGVAQDGVGQTIGTMIGYGPVEDPQFIILVKIDYARTNSFGSVTAGPIFQKIAEFLLAYYTIEPDRTN